MLIEGASLVEDKDKDNVLTSKYSLRNNRFMTVKYGRNRHDFCHLGSLLVELSEVVPDGIICFFTSYSHISLSIEMIVP